MFGCYQRYISKYAEFIETLREIQRSPPFLQKERHTKAMQSLKRFLVNATRLAFPNHREHVKITADASNISIDACLNQIQNGECQPKLSEAERTMSTFEKELLVIFAYKKRWRDLLDPGNMTILPIKIPSLVHSKATSRDCQTNNNLCVSTFRHCLCSKQRQRSSLFSRVASINDLDLH